MRTLLLAGAMAIGLIGAARADVVFSQNFDDPAFRGTNLGLTGSQASSDRWASTSYYTANSVDGITLNGPAYLAQNNANPSDQAILLNEGGSSLSFSLSNLVQGSGYVLSFLMWGDNAPGQAYSGYSAMNGTVMMTFAGIDGAPGTNPGTTELVYFLAAGTSATLTIGETSKTSASPIIDNIVVTSIPEPATLALLGAGLLGAGLARRRRAA